MCVVGGAGVGRSLGLVVLCIIRVREERSYVLEKRERERERERDFIRKQCHPLEILAAVLLSVCVCLCVYTYIPAVMPLEILAAVL